MLYGQRKTGPLIKKSRKGGGGSVIVWGMFYAAEIVPLIQLNGRMNANVQLWQQKIPSLQASLNQPTIFIEDDAPCDTPIHVKHFFKAKKH